MTQPSNIIWTFSGRQYAGPERRTTLCLAWEPDGSSLPYDEDLHGEEAWEVWIDWLEHHGDGDNHAVPIYWSVRGDGIAEHAPFAGTDRDEDFLTFFTWPVNSSGERRLRWPELSVCDGKAEWIYKLTGWRPAPYTTHMPVEQLAAALDLPAPQPRK
jgi:hypothetical protein